MIKILNNVKDLKNPTVLHIHSLKGKGYKLSENDKEFWHSTESFDPKTGEALKKEDESLNYKALTKSYILKKAKEDRDFCLLTPAMPRSIDLSLEERKMLKDQYLDTGIAEEACLSMAGAMAKAKAKPLVVTNATFMQRAYDQISQDICINKLAVTILLVKADLKQAKDMTHLGIFTVPIFSNIPNLVLLCPTCKSEYMAMLDWALDQNDNPVMILMPSDQGLDKESHYDFSQISKYKLEEKGEKIAIIGLGDFYSKAFSLSKYIEENFGFKPSLINPRFASGLDIELLEELKENHDLVITLENGIVSGGLGQKIASFYGDCPMIVKSYGLEKTFYDRPDIEKLFDKLRIRKEMIAQDIVKLNIF